MSDFTQLPEEELIARMKSDDAAAFSEIYRRYWKKLFAEAYKRLKNRELSEEVVQEIFTGLWMKRGGLEIRRTLAGYLSSSVMHYTIDYYRREAVRTRYREMYETTFDDSENSTENIVLLHELTSTIEDEVSRLPAQCRSVYELSRKQHKTNKEIAEYLGISEKTVENHLTKALKQLRFSLSQYLTLLIILLLK